MKQLNTFFMKSFVKKSTSVIALALITTGAMAQMNTMTTTESDSVKRFEKKSFRTWSIGLNAGILTHYTIFNNQLNGNFKTAMSDWGYGGYIKKQILPGFGLQADFLAGEVNGSRANSLPDNTPAQDNSKFRTHIDYSAALSANLTIANMSLNHKRSVLSPYVTAGAGYMSYATQVYNTPAGASTDFHQNWFIPVGAGFKFGIAKVLNLDFGYTVGFMKTNDFTGVLGARDDKFSYGHAGIEIALGKTKSSQLQNYSPIAALREDAAAESLELRNKIAMLETQRAADAAQYTRDMADDDADGVTNKFDKCPNTVSGTIVDGSGCTINFPKPPAPQVTERITEKIITITAEDRRIVSDAIKNLEFELGKSSIKESSNASLDRVAEILIQKNFSLKVAGHTDNIGSAAANMKLSKDRAEAVKAYLVDKGVNASLIEATGYGAGQPIASNKTAEGRQKNRRVEFSLR